MLLVLGAGGQVGRALVLRAGADARGLTRLQCDIADRRAVANAVSDPGLSAIVNCAAYTAVDRAESERDKAFAVNAEGASLVAQAAAARGLPLIHLSTDYVYGGKGDEPHREDESPAPVNIYGASKAAGDAAVIAAHPAHIVLRISWVFAVHGANFVKTILRLAQERRELRVVDDQHAGPTEARDIADAIIAIAARCHLSGFADWGIYHFCGAPATSWYGFAREILARAPGPLPPLVPIASRDYPRPARRPANSVLDCGRIGLVLGLRQPDWRAALTRVMTEIEGPAK